jgi:hypothetical protein
MHAVQIEPERDPAGTVEKPRKKFNDGIPACGGLAPQKPA